MWHGDNVIREISLLSLNYILLAEFFGQLDLLVGEWSHLAANVSFASLVCHETAVKGQAA